MNLRTENFLIGTALILALILFVSALTYAMVNWTTYLYWAYGSLAVLAVVWNFCERCWKAHILAGSEQIREGVPARFAGIYRIHSSGSSLEVPAGKRLLVPQFEIWAAELPDDLNFPETRSAFPQFLVRFKAIPGKRLKPHNLTAPQRDRVAQIIEVDEILVLKG